MDKRKKIILLFFTGIFMFYFFAVYCEETITRKEIYGRLISLSPLANPVYIGIEAMTERGVLNRDMHFHLEPGYRIIGKDFISNIKMGDVVIVGYDQIKDTTDQGEEEVKNIAKTIEFIKLGEDVADRERIRSRVLKQATN